MRNPLSPLGWVAVAIAALALVAVVYFVFVKPGQDREAAARARAGEIFAGAQGRSSDAATGAVAELGERNLDRAELGRQNREDILNAPNAGDDAGAAGDAGLRALCLRDSYRDSPRCVRLRAQDTAPAS